MTTMVLIRHLWIVAWSIDLQLLLNICEVCTVVINRRKQSWKNHSHSVRRRIVTLSQEETSYLYRVIITRLPSILNFRNTDPKFITAKCEFQVFLDEVLISRRGKSFESRNAYESLVKFDSDHGFGSMILSLDITGTRPDKRLFLIEDAGAPRGRSLTIVVTARIT